MTKASIVVVDFNGEFIEAAEVEPGRTFADTVMDQWPDGLDGSPIGGTPEGGILSEEDAVVRVIEPGEDWQIMLMPREATILISIALAIASAAVLLLLAPKLPKSQGNYEWDDSDRPQFYSGAQNQVQPGRRVRDAFGNIRVYPDIISAPAIRFSGTNQTIRELYVISNGTFVPDRTQFFDENFADIPNSAIAFYYPGQAWPTDFPIMRYNQSVNNIELPAENEVISFGLTYQLRGSYIYVEKDQYFSQFLGTIGGKFRLTGAASSNSGPQTVTSISADGRYLYVTPGFPTNQNLSTGSVSFIGIEWFYGSTNAVQFTVNNWILYKTVENEWPASDEDWYRSNNSLYWPTVQGGMTAVNVNTGHSFNTDVTTFNGLRYLYSINVRQPTGTYWLLRQTSGGIYNPDLPGTGYASQSYNVPGTATEAWLDFEFPTGLYQQEAGDPPQPRAVQIELYYRERIYADDTSGWQRQVLTYSAKTRTPRRFTHTLTFPKAGLWEVYCARLTPFTPDTETLIVADAVMWTALSGRQDVSALQGDTLNVTLADVRLNNQGLRSTGSDRRFNVTGWRHMYRYRVNSWGPTRQMSDAILYTLVDLANVPLQNIDTASLWAIQDELDAQSASDGEFSAVVDQSMSADDQVALIAGLSRTMVFRRAGTFYFSRPKGGINASSLINARNKIEPENRSFNFSQENDPDAIIIRYQNRALNYNEDTYQYPEGILPSNPEEQSILGACDTSTIQKIAKYNYNRNKYEKDTIQVKTTEESVMLAPGDVIYVTDHLMEAAPIDGEIVEVSGNTFTFDEPIPAGTYSGKIRDQWGDLHAIATVNVATTSNVITIPAWAGVAMPSGQYGPTTGLLYSFEEIQYDNANRFLVQSITPTRTGEVDIEGVLYREETYAGDGVQQVSSVQSPKVISDFDHSMTAPTPVGLDGQASIDSSKDVTAEVEAMEAEQEGTENG